MDGQTDRQTDRQTQYHFLHFAERKREKDSRPGTDEKHKSLLYARVFRLRPMFVICYFCSVHTAISVSCVLHVFSFNGLCKYRRSVKAEVIELVLPLFPGISVLVVPST
jgi:hypothetical protein